MSLKRARLLEQTSFCVDDTAEREDAAYRKEAGVKFRKHLLERYTTGAATAADTCILAHHHTESGGLGTEDLGLHPDQASIHGSRHLRLPGLRLAVVFWFGLWGLGLAVLLSFSCGYTRVISAKC